MSFSFYRQLNTVDCGSNFLCMVAKHYNADTSRQITGFSKQRVFLFGLSEIDEKLGFRTHGVQISYHTLQSIPLNAVMHWNQNHFVVLIFINRTSLTKIATRVSSIK